jgi:hypothetical protein
MPLNENSFLTSLIAIQQDGQGAISAPVNWLSKPLLEVKTELNQVVEDLAANALYKGGLNTLGRWHFFIGSPGNGKSAAAGVLARSLAANHCQIVMEDGTSLSDLTHNQIPYRLNVIEEGNRFSTLWIAQDASVLPDPYVRNPDPAISLSTLLQDAAARGVSLVVCTNRGVLEKVFANGHLDPTVNKQIWFKAVNAALHDREKLELSVPDVGQKRVFEKISVSSTPLDQRSLLLKRDIFRRAITRAVADENWVPCTTCEARLRCPYFQNRLWLQNEALLGNFISVLQRAEVLSGRVIVFREALALLSLILAGCPHEYADLSPCRWVHGRQKAGDWFSLLSRRIYASLFFPYSPLGLETGPNSRREQLDNLLKLTDIKNLSAEARIAVGHVVNDVSPALSSDVGVERLVGRNGIMREVDPFNDVLTQAFHDAWNEDSNVFLGNAFWISDLERECGAIWESAREGLGNSGESAYDIYRSLARWITAFTYRASALVANQITFGDELTDLVQIMSLENIGTEASVRQIEQLEKLIAEMLNPEGEGTRLSTFGCLGGDWAKVALRPYLDVDPNSESISLLIQFGKNGEPIPFNSMAFVWLKRRLERGMVTVSFPEAFLQTARDALERASSESKYFTNDSDIEIVIELPGDRRWALKRSRGFVRLDEMK